MALRLPLVRPELVGCATVLVKPPVLCQSSPSTLSTRMWQLRHDAALLTFTPGSIGGWLGLDGVVGVGLEGLSIGLVGDDVPVVLLSGTVLATVVVVLLGGVIRTVSSFWQLYINTEKRAPANSTDVNVVFMVSVLR